MARTVGALVAGKEVTEIIVTTTAGDEGGWGTGVVMDIAVGEPGHQHEANLSTIRTRDLHQPGVEGHPHRPITVTRPFNKAIALRMAEHQREEQEEE